MLNKNKNFQFFSKLALAGVTTVMIACSGDGTGSGSGNGDKPNQNQLSHFKPTGFRHDIVSRGGGERNIIGQAMMYTKTGMEVENDSIVFKSEGVYGDAILYRGAYPFCNGNSGMGGHVVPNTPAVEVARNQGLLVSVEMNPDDQKDFCRGR